MNFKLNILLDLLLGLKNIYLKLCPCGAIGREPMLDLECCSVPCCSWVRFPVATYVKEILSAEHKKHSNRVCQLILPITTY
jgi:hypothetical protein